MTAARELSDAELEALLERAAERGARRAIEGLADRDVAPRRAKRAPRVASAEAHAKVARINARKGIGR